MILNSGRQPSSFIDKPKFVYRSCAGDIDIHIIHDKEDYVMVEEYLDFAVETELLRED